MNLYQEEIYRSHLAHGVNAGYEWKKHKYIRKEGNRYIYPEDLQKTGRKIGQTINDRANSIVSAINKAKSAVKSGISNQVQKAKDRKFVSEHQDMPITQRNRQIRNAHQQAIPHGNTRNNPVPSSLELQKQKTAARKDAAEQQKNKEAIDRRNKQEAQIRSAHQGDTRRATAQIYTDGDRDFDDKNYKESGRVGDTDFFIAKRPDGKYVVLEEDTKWVLDKDTDINALKKRILASDKYVSDMYDSGHDYGDWYDLTTKAINGVDYSKQKVERKDLKADQKMYNQKAKYAGRQAEREHSRNRRATAQSYTDGDRDFDDENYEKATRLGNTDFHTFKRDDGKYVILEEDMKWVVDEKPSSQMIKNLEAFEDYAQRAQKNNVRYGAKDWERMASQAINGRDFTNVDTGKNRTSKAYQDQTRKYRTEDQINSAHRGSTKMKQGVLYTRKKDGKYTGKRRKV